MPALDHKNYKCKECSKKCNAWSESKCYKEKLCPKCYDKEHMPRRIN